MAASPSRAQFKAGRDKRELAFGNDVRIALPVRTAVLLSPRGHQRIFLSSSVAPSPGFSWLQQWFRRLVCLRSTDLSTRRREGLAVFQWRGHPSDGAAAGL